MNIGVITRWASAAVVTGIAGLALAAPASAQYTDDPVTGGSGRFFDDRLVIAPAPIEPGGELDALGTAGLAGLVLAGAGLAGAVASRRHQNLGHPA